MLSGADSLPAPERSKRAGLLLRALERPEKEVVDRALDVLGMLKPSGLGPRIDAMLASDSVPTRRAAALLLARHRGLPLLERMREEPWALAESGLVPRLMADRIYADAGLARAAKYALGALSQRASFRFRGDGDDAAAWDAWWALLQQEQRAVEGVRAVVEAATAVFEARDFAKYDESIAALRRAPAAYDALVNRGSRSSYEHGPLGIQSIRQLTMIMAKTKAMGRR